jgi:hypothetical protein
VHDREPVVEKLKNGKTAEDALEDDSTESSEAEILHPGPLVVTPEKIGEANDEEAEGRGDETVRMLEGNAADHGRVESAIRERPIGNGEGRVFGSDEGAGGKENDRPGCDE